MGCGPGGVQLTAYVLARLWKRSVLQEAMPLHKTVIGWAHFLPDSSQLASYFYALKDWTESYIR